MIWTPDNVRRIVLDAAGRVLQRPHAGLPTDVDPDLDLHADVGLSSLQRMELAAHLNELFGLLHTSADNYLLASTRLSYWVDCVLRARQHDDTYLTFRTSGTTGAAKAVRHSMASLLTEAQSLMALLPRPDQVVSTVAANHIYGFIYTVLLPALWLCPARLLADVPAIAITPGTLLVGTPFTWEWLSQSVLPALPGTCRGTTSTAPMSPAQFSTLTEVGVELLDIYGSSDTGGIATRRHPDEPLTLMPHLTLLPGEPAVLRRADSPDTYLMPDRIELVTNRQFRVLGRLDEAVQIAGVNVCPAHIRQVLAACPLVADADVYAKAVAGETALYAAIRLRTLTDATRDATLRWLREHLTAPEQPEHVYVY